MTALNDRVLVGELLTLVRKDKRRRSRWKAFGKFLGSLAQAALVSLAHGLYLMLAVGIVHHEWIPGCPTIGYWWAVLLAVLVRGALNYVPTKSGAEQ